MKGLEEIQEFRNIGSTSLNINSNSALWCTEKQWVVKSEVLVIDVNYHLIFSVVTFLNISEKWSIRAEWIQQTKDRNQSKNGMNQIEK